MSSETGSPLLHEIPDVDLDVRDRDTVVTLFPEAIVASQEDDHGGLTRHNTGLYFQAIPRDPQTDLAAFPYKIAEELGYYKVDMLSYQVYDLLENTEELLALLDRAESDSFPWHWFGDDRFYEAPGKDSILVLTHLGRHQRVCKIYPPESVLDVATLNALIRPGKKYLIGQPWETIQQQVWIKNPDEGYFFKKSHAVAFALVILIHMQVIARELQIGD